MKITSVYRCFRRVMSLGGLKIKDTQRPVKNKISYENINKKLYNILRFRLAGTSNAFARRPLKRVRKNNTSLKLQYVDFQRGLAFRQLH